MGQRRCSNTGLVFAIARSNLKPFRYVSQEARVVFGAGALNQLGGELGLLGLKRVLILCGAGHADLAGRIASALGVRAAGVFAKAVMHVPKESVEKAAEAMQQARADGVVCLGGGSATGLAKALALAYRTPIVAVPTTYAGSEVTSIYGITENGVKRTGRDPIVLPRTVIYDPELTVTLPWSLTVTSAFNAIAHAAEGLYAHDGNPIAALMAEEGIRAIALGLQRLAKEPQDLEARADLLYGAWLCGNVLGAVSMGLHHKLAHTLGGSFNLAHAEVHSILLPYALAYNATEAPEAMERIARALGVDRAPLGLFELGRRYDVPTGLKSIGMPASGLERAADLAVQNPYPNPRPLERLAIRRLLQGAFDAAEPNEAYLDQ